MAYYGHHARCAEPDFELDFQPPDLAVWLIGVRRASVCLILYTRKAGTIVGGPFFEEFFRRIVPHLHRGCPRLPLFRFLLHSR